MADRLQTGMHAGLKRNFQVMPGVAWLARKNLLRFGASNRLLGKKMSRPSCCFSAAALVALASWPSIAGSQQFPERPVRMIVPYPPGGGSDLVARLIGKELADKWGKSVIIDNRPGGDGADRTLKKRRR